MSNTLSKLDMNKCNFDYDYADDCDHDYECVGNKSYSDKLVLKLEEIDVDTQRLRVKCFVVYDQTEREYFICGKAQKLEDQEEPEDFKFYCKKRKHVIEFLNYIFQSPEKTENLNHVLYNFKYLDEYDCVDFWVLEDQENASCELTGYDGADFNKSWLSPLLKTLKHVRY